MSNSSSKQINIKITGMTCAACTGRVERKLTRMDGVESATASLATNSVYIKYDPTMVEPDALSQAIIDVGFGISNEVDSDMDMIKSVASLKRRFIIGAILGLPVFILAMGGMVGLPTYKVPYNFIIQFVLSIVVFFYAGYPFYSIAIPNLRKLVFDMNTLITIGTTAAFIFSVAIVFFPNYWTQHGVNEPYFESVCVIIVVVLLGRVIEAGAKHDMAQSITKLFELTPQSAVIVVGGLEQEIAAKDVKEGDVLRLRPGGAIAVDGEVLTGFATVDESILTGESAPVDKHLGANLYAGTHILSGSIDYKATKVGNDTVLAAFIQQVEEAVYSKAPIQKLVDKISSVFVPVVVVVAIITFILWFTLSSEARAIISFVTVLIIACPCALGLATPSAVMAASGRGAVEGILIRNGEILENAGKINTVVLDKTGTLTKGTFVLQQINTELDENRVLQLVASVESLSEHPIAKAIVNVATDKKIDLLPVTEFNSHIGGVEGKVDNIHILIGTKSFLSLQNTGTPYEPIEGLTTFYVAFDSKGIASIALGDEVREESKAVISRLNEMGVESIMLSGDNDSVCRYVAELVGITKVHSEAKPDDKRDVLLKLKESGQYTAMVGDGINDAAALAEADVGIAMADGSDIAISSADITLMGSDLRKLPRAINLSRQTGKIIKQNLFWAFIYNVIGIPIAAGILYPAFKIQLSPMIAGVAMAFSSVTVILNALRLRRLNID